MSCPSRGACSSGMPSSQHRIGRQQGQCAFDARDLPHRAMPMSRQTAQRVGGRERFEIAPVELSPLGEIGDAVKGTRGTRSEQPGRCLASTNASPAVDPSAAPGGHRAAARACNPSRCSDGDGAHLHAVSACIAHQLRRR